MIAMMMLMAFAPFIAFAAADRLIGSAEGLLAGFAVSAAMLLRDWLAPERSPKLLEIGTAALFAALALYTLLGHATWSIMGVRLAVDSGLFLIVVLSIAIRQPFTLQYAREQVPQVQWSSREFLHTNDVISAAWALAFLVLITADAVLLTMPDLPPRFGIIAIVLALVGAFKFTGWYPNRDRATVERTVR
jgi:hypothetical protein